MRNSAARAVVGSSGQLTSYRLSKMARLMLATAPIAGALLWHASAFGQTLTWAPGGADGDGNWDTSTLNWNPGGVAWVNGDSAIFGSGGTAGTVTIIAPITASSLTFNSVGSGDYLIASDGVNT